LHSASLQHMALSIIVLTVIAAIFSGFEKEKEKRRDFKILV